MTAGGGNFVRTARVRMQEIQKTAPQGTIITWLVYRDAYLRRAAADHDPLTAHVESVRNTYKIDLVWFRSGEEVIRYINEGGAAVSQASSQDFWLRILRSLEQELLPLRLQFRHLRRLHRLAA